MTDGKSSPTRDHRRAFANRLGGVLQQGYGMAEALPEAQGEIRLLPSLRYAHAERYLRELASRHGLRAVPGQPGTAGDDVRP